MEMILGTHNDGKKAQIAPMFAHLPVTLRSLKECGVSEEEAEDQETLLGNARKKAYFAFTKTKILPALAEDTGFMIEALNGLPGVHAKRWAGEGATDEEVMQYTLTRMRDVPPGNRAAVFKTVVVLMPPFGNAIHFEGVMWGSLLTEPKGERLPHMPYSSIFVPDDDDRVLAEIPIQEMNKLSHRGRAFRAAIKYLEEQVLMLAH